MWRAHVCVYVYVCVCVHACVCVLDNQGVTVEQTSGSKLTTTGLRHACPRIGL